jgi:predicted regulator of Ras-like GTPase activity (Roadblock/LC7/MglB family)
MADRESGAADAGSRAARVRAILAEVTAREHVRGGLLVAPDGFVIASELPPEIALEPLAAVAATLGRELELGADQLGRGALGTAFFSADDGSLFLGGSPVGFLVVVAGPGADAGRLRDEVKRSADALQQVWRAGDHRGGNL